ncbi:hypothetical protein NHF46_17680 [Arthrobacter alpinus]|nr:hypothetical protein [Arthrobacter alpinus]
MQSAYFLTQDGDGCNNSGVAAATDGLGLLMRWPTPRYQPLGYPLT